MPSVLIVGSGASGVHFALTILRKGYHVTLIDAGSGKPDIVRPQDSFNDLKSTLDDPVRYFLGADYGSVVFPGPPSQRFNDLYSFPPNKEYVFARPPQFACESAGFEALLSFAQGGLGEAWRAGVYPFSATDLQDFPFTYGEIEPYYEEVARRIGVSGELDDMARLCPLPAARTPALQLDAHSAFLLAAYDEHRRSLNEQLGVYMGRALVATLGAAKGERAACTYCGRCLWGCPTGALYTPSLTLEECKRYASFRYLPATYVMHFESDSERRIRHAVVQSLADGSTRPFTADRYVLAAGTLSTSKIFLDSLVARSGEIVELRGLMDNRQILMPFVTVGRIGAAPDSEAYQYHQIAVGLESEEPAGYVHGQVTTLKTALVHPILNAMPLGFRASLSLFRSVRAALGILNLNFSDARREDSVVTLRMDGPSQPSVLRIAYSSRSDEDVAMRSAVRRARLALRQLGCIVPPGMVHVRPKGASAHYAGTIPMSTERSPLTVSRDGRSHDFEDLFIVDGATMPFLPAKNYTFTLMANAVRVAERSF